MKDSYISVQTFVDVKQKTPHIDTVKNYYNLQRTGKVYQTKIWKFATNPTSVGEKLLDNAGLEFVPSTDTTEGKDDYLNGNHPMFEWVHCNYKRNDDGTAYPVATEYDSNYVTIVTAQAEIGYMEKQSNAQLDDKNTNVGDGNYTKYWRDLKPIYQGQPWCAVFVSWIMYKTFGLETAKKLLKHENDFPYVYCPTLGARFTKYANPQRGDIVIFYRNGTFAHTGIVTKVEGDKFYTIEGNTSNGSTIIANGGEVCSKHYNNSNLPGTKFCRPDYSIVKSIMNSSSTSKPSQTTYNKWVGAATKNGTDVFTNSTGTSKLSTYPKLNKGNLVDVIGVSGTRYQVKIADKFVGYVEKTNIKDPNAVVTKPSASTSKPAKKGYNKSEKWKGVIIAKSGLKVRKSPGTSNADLECSFSPLKYNTPVSVCDSTTGSDGNKWYYICYKGKYGFSSAKYIKKK